MILNQVGLPNKIGLYNPENEKDACGVGFIVSIDGNASNKIIQDAKKMLIRMSHRGACACDTGDGAGILTSMPHNLFAKYLKYNVCLYLFVLILILILHFLRQDSVDLPDKGSYAVAMLFLDSKNSNESEKVFEEVCKNNGVNVLHWRQVPVNSTIIGKVARSREPLIKQVLFNSF
jgi:glutamate synthase (NADH)